MPQGTQSQQQQLEGGGPHRGEADGDRGDCGIALPPPAPFATLTPTEARQELYLADSELAGTIQELLYRQHMRHLDVVSRLAAAAAPAPPPTRQPTGYYEAPARGSHCGSHGHGHELHGPMGPVDHDSMMGQCDNDSAACPAPVYPSHQDRLDTGLHAGTLEEGASYGDLILDVLLMSMQASVAVRTRSYARGH